MNVENITALAEQLLALGFADLRHQLAKRICFRPQAFSIVHAVEKAGRRMEYCLAFERGAVGGMYALRYYDASLQPQNSFENDLVSGVLVKELNERMAAVDWKEAFAGNERKTADSKDAADWSVEKEIDSIIVDLETLEGTSEGKDMAVLLKQRHWRDSGYQQLFQTLLLPKGKAEICQRFYCLEGQPGIAAEEALRFLQNRQLEKEMQVRRKQMESPHDAKEGDESGTGLPGKRRGKRTKKIKAGR